MLFWYTRNSISAVISGLDCIPIRRPVFLGGLAIHSTLTSAIRPKIQSFYVCLVGLLMLSSVSTTRLYRERVQRLSSGNFTCCHTRVESGETMTSVSAGHIILTPTQPVGSRWPKRGLNSGAPYQESRTLSTELPCPHPGFMGVSSWKSFDLPFSKLPVAWCSSHRTEIVCQQLWPKI